MGEEHEKSFLKIEITFSEDFSFIPRSRLNIKSIQEYGNFDRQFCFFERWAHIKPF